MADSKGAKRGPVPKTIDLAFSHRQNGSGSTDSICLKCFRRIATETKVSILRRSEIAHACEGFDLGNVLYPEITKSR